MTLLIIIHIVVCVFLVCVILLQPGKADGGGIGFGSSSQSIFGSKGAGNFLTKTTSVMAIMYLLTSFVLTRSRIKEYTSSVINAGAASTVPAAKPTTPPAPGGVPTTSVPTVPATPEKGAEASKAPAATKPAVPKAGEPTKK